MRQRGVLTVGLSSYGWYKCWYRSSSSLFAGEFSASVTDLVGRVSGGVDMEAYFSLTGGRQWLIHCREDAEECCTVEGRSDLSDVQELILRTMLRLFWKHRS